MNDFLDISEDTIRYYFGDLHIIDEIAYKVKFFKPTKLKIRMLENPTQASEQIKYVNSNEN